MVSQQHWVASYHVSLVCGILTLENSLIQLNSVPFFFQCRNDGQFLFITGFISPQKAIKCSVQLCHVAFHPPSALLGLL